MNVMIDPAMYTIIDAGIIIESLRFYKDVIQLCQNGVIRVCLSRTLREKLFSYKRCPFPINLSIIEDKNDREIANSINTLFLKTILNHECDVEIDNCKGNQEFLIFDIDSKNIDKNSLDESTQEMLWILLRRCYSKHPVIDNRVLSNINVGIKIIEKCSCQDISTFSQEIEFVDTSVFIDETIISKEELCRIIKKGKIEVVPNPPVETDGTHHLGTLQKKPKSLKDLSRNSKTVLKILAAKFGLSKIHLRDYSSGSLYEVGTLELIEYTNNSDVGMITCNLYCDDGKKRKCQLYFPVEITELLYKSFKSKISYDELIDLVQRI